MTSQEQGMMLCATAVRQIVPPQLEAVIIVYPPDKPDQVASIIATASAHYTAIDRNESHARSVKAAAAYVKAVPNAPGFRADN